MDDIKSALPVMYNDLLGYVDQFNQKNYQSVFEELDRRYRSLTDACIRICEEAGDAEDERIEELARVLPEHVSGLLEGESGRKREMHSVDLNMAMTIYVFPLLQYTRNPIGEKLAERTAQIWNETNATALTLGTSSYDNIMGGFKKSIFCYITTAVCEQQNKPDDCYELTTLRAYRDGYMMQREADRELVEEYYEIAPRIVLAIDMQKDADQIYQGIYEKYLEPCVRDAEAGRNEECKKRYVDMVRSLEAQYISKYTS